MDYGNQCLAKLAYPPLSIALAFYNGFEDRSANVKRLNGDDLSTFGKNLVNFRPKPQCL